MRFTRFHLAIVLALSSIAVLAGFTLQDTTAVQDTIATPAPSTGIGLGGFLIGYVLKFGVPLAVAWIFKQWNVAVDWMNQKSDWLKMAFYVGFTLVGMYLFQLLGLGWDRSTDPNHLGPDFFTNLLVAIVGTLQVKLGIRTEQARLAKMVPAESHAYVAELRVRHAGVRKVDDAR